MTSLNLMCARGLFRACFQDGHSTIQGLPTAPPAQ
jgi:hypothetical protein